jgi:hypothetical protein
MVLLEITGDDLMASSVLNDQSKVSGGEILAGETPVSCAFPRKEGQFSLPATWAAAVNDVVRYRRDMRRRGFIFICFLF